MEPTISDERQPLHSEPWGLWFGLIALAAALFCLFLPFLLIGCLLTGDFGSAAVLAVQLTGAAIALRTILRHQNTVWMTPDGIEFGDPPQRVRWRHVRDVTPFLYGASGFHTLTFSDGTPDLHFIGSAGANERLERARRGA